MAASPACAHHRHLQCRRHAQRHERRLGGQWDYEEIVISLGSHATTDNLTRCGEFTVAFATRGTLTAADYVGVVSGRKDAGKMERTGWKAAKASCVNAPVFDCFQIGRAHV